MSQKLKILRNSFFLIVQPLIMNFITLLVMGYIARKLGPSDFGIFNFVTTFTMLFYPIAVFGLNRISVRDLSVLNSENKSIYVGKILPFRIIMIIVAICLIILSARLLNYPSRTEYAIYLGCTILVFQLFSEFITEIFNSFERMEFTALIKMIAGIVLTALSVIILYLGYGLYHLIGVYAVGQLCGVVLGICLLLSLLPRVELRIDFGFIKSKFGESFPFFLMTMMWFVMMGFDTIILSKKVSMTEIGLYTSATLLVSRISIIAQGLSNAVLPTISKLHNQGKNKEIEDIMCTFITKIVFVTLPGCILISLFSNDIMQLIFGKRYFDAGIILSISIWVFLFRCFAGIQFGILTAFRMQEKMAKVYIITTIYCVVANLLLIYNFKTIGAVIAFSSTQLFIVILFSNLVYKLNMKLFYIDEFGKIILLNISLLIFLLCLKSYNFIFVVILSICAYFVAAFLIKLFNLNDLKKVTNLFWKKI